MSAANPTTHPASTSNARSGRPSRGAMEDASDLKALHSKYAGSVKTLKELFPDWTEDDLIFALEETEGDLEDTINHITEGHAAKWGEVKSRKEKRQAAKPKLQHRDEPRSADKTSHVPRPASFRGGIRGGAPRGGRSANTHAGARTKPAAAAAAPAVPVASASEGSGWDLAPADDNSNADSWGAEAAKPAAKPAAAAPADTAAAPAKASSMSWANIAKRGAKPAAPEAPKHAEASEDVAVPAPVPETQLQSEGPWPVAVSVNAVSASEPVAEVAAIEDTTVQDAPLAEVAEESVAQPAAAPEPVAQDGVPVTEVPVIQPSPKKPASNARRLNQDAPVVMPSGNATVERIGVQFGSLSIGGVEVGSLAGAGAERPAGEAAPEPAVESVAVQHKAPAVAAPKAEAAPVAAVPMPVHAQQAAVESAAAAQAPLTAYLQQQQQQQQLHQQHHVPVQAHPNASGISQMPLPNDYGTAALYGVDAQRNPMGFYDNYAYGQYAAGKDGAGPNAGAADPRTPATSGQQAAGVSAGANHLGQAGLFPQQVPQPFGMPYYNHPYYYNMVQPGGQYHNPAYGNNPALAAAYAQPFMKQGMYPMYPGATPQGMQAVGAQHAPQQQGQHITQQQAQQQQAQQQQQQQQQQQHSPAQQQQAQQQGGAKGPGASAQSSAAQYANISAQKNANAYGHYAANIGSGFGVYEQDPAALSNSPQQYGFGGLPEFLAGAKNGGKDASGKGAHPAGTAPVIGGTTYYSTPQQPGGYPTQASSAHPQAFSHQQQAYYSPYAHNYGQTQMPHGYQQQQQAQAQAQQHPPQAGHPQANKHYWNKQ